VTVDKQLTIIYDEIYVDHEVWSRTVLSSRNTGKCRRYDSCPRLQALMKQNWKGIEDTMVHAILKTCAECPDFERAEKPSDRR
jgi:hypothetical protein